MKRKLQINVRLKFAFLLSIILLTSFFFNYSTNNFNISTNSENITKDEEIDTDVNLIEEPKSSVLGDDTWWDSNYQYRRVISITNPYTVNFTDFVVNFTFNYAELGNNIRSDLNDIRIVENDILRSYYVLKDYPITGEAIVWFDTNITESTTERDTYMYYGYSSAENSESDDPSESFGWIKNGDFELDGDEVATKFIPFGWNFTDNPVDNVADLKTPGNGMVPLDSETPNDANNNSASSYESFVFKLTTEPDVGSQEDLGNGDYAYKWGAPVNNVEGGTVSSVEYAGTLYSYPFKVPKIEGGGIKLEFWRNIRTYLFEVNTKGGAAIDYDGYFIRLCNGSAAKYTYDVDSHENADNTNFDNYVEAYGGKSAFKGNVWKWENELRGHFDDSQNEKDTALAELTGDTEIDISKYEGKEIFLEFGSWGQENGDDQQNNKRSAFFQLDYVRFNYTLEAEIDEIQSKTSNVEIIANDIDGRIVPNAKIFIVNESARGTSDFVVDSGIATDGTFTFMDVPRGKYNFTVNYTLGSQDVEVFNSTDSGLGPYYINGINYTIQLQLNLWTIDFEIVDWDGYPLSLGYIEVNESKGSNRLDTLTLDDMGKATFRWLNASSYYYKVFYDNDDYSSNPVALNESYIIRSDYIQNAEYNAKSRSRSINVKDTHVGNYSVSERIYTNGSRTELGSKKIIKANITLTDMENYLTDISVYYIDKDNSTDGNLIYSETYPPPPDEIQDDFIQLDISLIDSNNLKNDNFEAYGLLIVVNGFNASVSNGIIKVDLIETCNIFNKTPLARINIKTVYYNELLKDIDEISAFIKIFNGTSGSSLVNLTSAGDAIPPLEDGYAYGIMNKIPFWYLIGQVYNFTIDVANETDLGFNVTVSGPGPSQWTPGPGQKIYRYNYTLYGNSSITFFIIPDVDINFTDFDTAFNSSYGDIEAFWGDNLFYWGHFLFTDDGWKTDDNVIKPPGRVYLNIKLTATGELLITKELDYISNGNFTITVNSSILSAGNNYVYYTFELEGYHPTYDNPTPVSYLVKVKAIPTTIASYNYESRLLLTDNLYAQNYEELVNITIAYNISATGEPLIGATVIYSWDFGSGTLESDQIWEDYFTAAINTADALSTGIKIISVSASYENYSLAPLTIYLNVLKRSTTLNNQSGLVYSNPKIWVQDAHYYNFTYRDAKTTNIISNLDMVLYSWQELDENGNVIAGKSGSGTLTQNVDNTTYTLDFNTELRPVGFYQMYITLGEENYEEKFALINLEIRLREFDADLDAKGLEDDQINIVKGDKVELEIELLDETRGNIQLTGAKVVLEIGGEEYEFDEDDPGIYTYTFDTEEFEAFFTSQTLTGEIIIKKANFTTDEIDITIVVEMEEISEGVPTFYFIMVVAAISAIIGSLVSYRIIQQARIPKHVKRLREVKKKIKAGDSIPKSLLVPSKEEFIVKQLGEAYNILGVSLEKTLGIKDKKSKPSPEIKDKLKQGGGDL